jgi:hypothetical protein
MQKPEKARKRHSCKAGRNNKVYDGHWQHRIERITDNDSDINKAIHHKRDEHTSEGSHLSLITNIFIYFSIQNIEGPEAYQ